jgi:hypothetical protein
MSVRPEVVLLLGAAGVGVLALLFPLLLRQDEPPLPLPRLRFAVALGAIALLFGLTRLRDYPFSPGGTLGDGLAVGGAIALLTVALAGLWTETAAAAVGAGGGALLGAAIVLLWHRGYPNAALAGFGAGHAIATLLAGGGEEEVRGEGAGVRGQEGLWAGPVMAAIVAGAALLAIDRADDMRAAERLALDGKVWWVWPTVVMAAALAGQMVGLSLFARRAWAGLGAGLVATLLLLLLWLRFPRYAPLMAPPAAGFVTALLVLPGVRGQGSGVRGQEIGVGDAAGAAQDPKPDTLLPALVAPALLVVLLAAAYRLYTGYGIALAALGAAALLPWLAEREPRAAGRSLFGLLAAAVLFRVYYQSYDLRGSDIPLTAHYAMVSLIAGALAPFALAALQGVRGQGSGVRGQGSGPALVSVACLVAAVALPALLTLFWGQKVGGGLLLGLVIGQGFRMMAALLESESMGGVAAVAAQVPEAALLVMAWVTVQLLDRVEAYGLQLLRVQRVGLIAAVIVVCLLAIFYRAWSGSAARGIITERG